MDIETIKKAARLAVKKYFEGMETAKAIEEATKECNVKLKGAE